MSNREPSIKLNMLMNTVLTVSSVVFPLITMPYVTRVLGPQGVGRVYFASSVVTAFAVVAELGIPVYGIRACARVRDDREELSRTSQEILLINMITCIAVYVCLGAAVVLIPRLARDRLLIAVMSSSIVLNAVGAEWLYKALEKYAYITVRSIVFKLAALAGMFLMIRKPDDYVMYGALTVFAAAASNIVNMMRLREFISLKPEGLRRYDLRRHLPAMMTLFMLAAAASIYNNLDLAFLGFMKGDAEAGVYGIAVRIKLVTVNLITSVSAVLMPRISMYYSRDRYAEADDILRRTMIFISAASAASVMFFELTAELCVGILAGRGFAGAVLPLRIMMPAVIFIGISNLIGLQMMVPMGRERLTLRAALIGAATDVALNILLIPAYASTGAAAAALTAEVSVCCYLAWKAACIRREYGLLR